MAQQTISKMETVQTAVDWFFDNLKNHEIQAQHFELYQQAKQMEKEQIINTYLNACARVTPYGYYNDSAEQYYNDKYKTT